MKSRWMLVLAFGLAVAPAWAQKGGVVRLIVPFATGGPTDIAARVIAPYLGERTARPWVVENKVGATGAIGTELVAHAHRAGGEGALLSSRNRTGPAGQVRISHRPAGDWTKGRPARSIGASSSSSMTLACEPRGTPNATSARPSSTAVTPISM